ncbi:MAG: AAA family ATPase [Dethiobacter sp.]|nr:AAA family ATPase [Dethiobacter sp.]
MSSWAVPLQTNLPKLGLRLLGTNNKGLQFTVVITEQGLLATGANFWNSEKQPHELEFKGELILGGWESHRIPLNWFNKLFAAQTREERVSEVDKRLERWKAFLYVQEKMAEKKKFILRYTNRKYVKEDDSVIRVNVNPESDQDLKKLMENVRRDTVYLVAFNEEENSLYYQDDDNRINAKILDFDVNNQSVRLRLEEEDYNLLAKGRIEIPAEGWIENQARGQLHLIRIQDRAIERLKKSGGLLPNLDKILYGGSEELGLVGLGSVEPIPEERCLNPALTNYDQRKAVSLAMASPDCFFMQGPPGTGKTTFIAELCYQIVREEDKRVLVSSQANLAVDNALSRLHKHPDIRAVRIGSKYEDEGLEFVQERAVKRWLLSVAENSIKKLDKLEKLASRKSFYQDNWDYLLNWAKLAEEWLAVRESIYKKAQTLEETIDKDKANLAYLTASRDNLAMLGIAVQQIEIGLRSTENVVFEEPALWGEQKEYAVTLLKEVWSDIASPWQRASDLQFQLIEIQPGGAKHDILQRINELLFKSQEVLQEIKSHNDLVQAREHTIFNLSRHLERKKDEVIILEKLLQNGLDKTTIELHKFSGTFIQLQERLDSAFSIISDNLCTKNGSKKKTLELINAWERAETAATTREACSLLEQILASFRFLRYKANKPFIRIWYRAKLNRGIEELRTAINRIENAPFTEPRYVLSKQIRQDCANKLFESKVEIKELERGIKAEVEYVSQLKKSYYFSQETANIFEQTENFTWKYRAVQILLKVTRISFYATAVHLLARRKI